MVVIFKQSKVDVVHGWCEGYLVVMSCLGMSSLACGRHIWHQPRDERDPWRSTCGVLWERKTGFRGWKKWTGLWRWLQAFYRSLPCLSDSIHHGLWHHDLGQAMCIDPCEQKL